MMRDEVLELSQKITGHIEATARSVSRNVWTMKAAVVLASATSAVMQFMPPSDAAFTPHQLIGGLAAAIAALFGVYVLFSEKDAAQMLADANRALNAAQESDLASEQYMGEIADYADQLDKSVELYVAMSNARGIYEQAIATKSFQVHQLLQDLLDTNKRRLAAALNIQTSDTWTLCIYRAYPSPTGSRELKVVAHIRAIECTPEKARVWPEGVGFAGISLSSAQEIVVGDLHHPSVGPIFNVNNGLARQHDTSVYKSAVACPIFVGKDNDRPWGVVSATNNRANHFVDGDTPKVQNAEAIRAVAGMAAVIVALCEFGEARQSEQAVNEK